MGKYNKDLTVYIPVKNEQKHIGQCIESILEGTKNFDTEIIVVDSMSNDKTIEIAKKYNVRILQLNPSYRMSCAAGHYIALNNCNGEFVFNLDGHSYLEKGFIEKGIAYLKKNKDVIGVAGQMSEPIVSGTNIIR